MLIGLLPNASSAEILLNNLSEADFDLNTVSVIMKDVNMRNKIAKDVGPFKGVHPDKLSEKLAKAGLTEAKVKLCTEALTQSKALVAMDVSANLIPAAKEMFTDQLAEIVKE